TGRVLLCLLTLIPVPGSAQTNPAAQAARTWRQAHERAIVDELVALLSLPNITRDTADVRKNADLILKMMAARSISGRLITADGANPIVFGEIRTPGATRTVVFYAHYDGQPLDPKEWTTPPFTPTLRSQMIETGGRVIAFPPPGTPFDPESRLYARSAGDD